MASDFSELVRLEKSHLRAASEVLSRAFIDDPDLARFVPEKEKRARLLPSLFRVELSHGIQNGEVYAPSPDLEGIAMWLPSGTPDITLWSCIGCGGLALTFRADWRFLRQMKRENDFASRLRKRLAPFSHWYLAILGVAPEFQGKGYASRLLRPMLARLEAAHSPVYLETDTEQYVPLYQHFGFKVITEETLPGSGSKMWVMLREKAD